MYWKRFTAEQNIWEREENLKNIKKIVINFEKRINIEVQRQEKIRMAEE